MECAMSMIVKSASLVFAALIPVVSTGTLGAQQTKVAAQWKDQPSDGKLEMTILPVGALGPELYNAKPREQNSERIFHPAHVAVTLKNISQEYIPFRVTAPEWDLAFDVIDMDGATVARTDDGK